MKLHFESNIDYQLQAIEAVCDLFRGQEICRTEFTVTQHALGDQQLLDFVGSDLGIGNQSLFFFVPDRVGVVDRDPR